MIKQVFGFSRIFSYIAQVGFLETKSFSVKTQIDGTNVVGQKYIFFVRIGKRIGARGHLLMDAKNEERFGHVNVLKASLVGGCSARDGFHQLESGDAGKGQMFSRSEQGAFKGCPLYTSPSPRDGLLSRMPSSA